MSTKYIADLHLYDSYSVDWRSYLSLSLDDYAKYLVQEWNNSTEDSDVVIIAGDVGHLCPMTLEVLQQLKGTKILVIGNHDVTWGNMLYDNRLFAGTHEQILNNGIFVAHKPDVVRPANCTYFVHGHHHTYEPLSMRSCLKDYARDTYRLNCAADLIGHRPRTLQSLILQKELLLEKYKSTNLI